MKPSSFVSLGNVRRDLGDLTDLLISIAHNGVQVPISYYAVGDQNVVWDGHRRLKCVEIINVCQENHEPLNLDNCKLDPAALEEIGGPIDDVPAVPLVPPKGSTQAIEFQLLSAAEGLRQPLNPIDEARAISELLALGRTAGQVGNLLGKSDGYISRRHRLVDLHPDFKQAVIRGNLSPRAAEEILQLKSAEDGVLRRSLIGAKTVRAIRTKVLAANAVSDLEDQPPLPETGELVVDPLVLVLREEAKIKVQEVVKSLHALKGVYERVDEKPALNEIRLATKWIGKED